MALRDSRRQEPETSQAGRNAGAVARGNAGADHPARGRAEGRSRPGPAARRRPRDRARGRRNRSRRAGRSERADTVRRLRPPPRRGGGANRLPPLRAARRRRLAPVAPRHDGRTHPARADRGRGAGGVRRLPPSQQRGRRRVSREARGLRRPGLRHPLSRRRQHHPDLRRRSRGRHEFRPGNRRGRVVPFGSPAVRMRRRPMPHPIAGASGPAFASAPSSARCGSPRPCWSSPTRAPIRGDCAWLARRSRPPAGRRSSRGRRGRCARCSCTARAPATTSHRRSPSTGGR